MREVQQWDAQGVIGRSPGSPLCVILCHRTFFPGSAVHHLVSRALRASGRSLTWLSPQGRSFCSRALEAHVRLAYLTDSKELFRRNVFCDSISSQLPSRLFSCLVSSPSLSGSCRSLVPHGPPSWPACRQIPNSRHYNASVMSPIPK